MCKKCEKCLRVFEINEVEYLNAPARPEFPQAMKRARNGHPEPYGVKYFEIGNETYHDNHNLKPHRRFSVEAYVDFARKTIEQVRRVDPSVKIGVVGHTMNLDSRPDFWDETVYRELGPHVDFIIHHYYAPKLDSLSPIVQETEASDVLYSILMETFPNRPLTTADTIPLLAYTHGILHTYVIDGKELQGGSYCDVRDAKLPPVVWRDTFDMPEYIWFDCLFASDNSR